MPVCPLRPPEPATSITPGDPQLVGRWQRTLLVRPDGSRDPASSAARASTVTWLQAGSHYVDLRLPADPAAPVEGFAGRLRADGPWTCWDRDIDLHPPTGTPDEGRLEPMPGGLLETGRHEAYLEHWARRTGPDLPWCSAELADPRSGARALLVRVGDDVGWARAQHTDTEVALGVVADDGTVELTAGSHAGTHLTVGPEWQLVATDGDPASLPTTSARKAIP